MSNFGFLQKTGLLVLLGILLYGCSFTPASIMYSPNSPVSYKTKYDISISVIVKEELPISEKIGAYSSLHDPFSVELSNAVAEDLRASGLFQQVSAGSENRDNSDLLLIVTAKHFFAEEHLNASFALHLISLGILNPSTFPMKNADCLLSLDFILIEAQTGKKIWENQIYDQWESESYKRQGTEAYRIGYNFVSKRLKIKMKEVLAELDPQIASMVKSDQFLLAGQDASETKNNSFEASNHQPKTNVKRLALIIGNSKYPKGASLSNPVNDVRAISGALRSVGFDVMKHENLGQRAMKQAIDDFGKRLKNYGVGLFFYAGHGIQVKGNNYLMPSDAGPKSENQVEYDCIRADRVLAMMEEAGTTTNIVILDACRDNPFERSWSRSSSGHGLAFMNAPSGSLIAYATAPGKTASDGTGVNGLFTSALLQHIKKPGIKIEDVFKRVRATVEETSGGMQTPWESTSLKGDFYFNGE